MRRQRLWWGGGALLGVILAVSLLIWRPWRLPYGDQVACTYYQNHPQAGQPMCITWAQAQSRYPAWVRQPTWLPPTVQWQQLTVSRPVEHVTSPPGLTILHQMPQGASIQVFENPGIVHVSFGKLITNGKTIAPPHVQSNRLNGKPVHFAGWTVHNPGSATHLKQLWFDVDRHTYQVLGINVSWADVNGVAASLIQ